MSVRAYTPDEIPRAVLKRRWLILTPLAIGLAMAPVLAPLVPERYRSETLILVIPQRVPDNYVKATVTDSVEERLPAITEQILSRSRLERIIQDMDLYKAERATEVMEDVVAKMRVDVVVSLAAAKKERADSFRVSYVSHDPEVARKVTERLASLYIEQNVNDRESQAQNTSQFLSAQLDDAKRRLIDQEKKLEEYRRKNSGQLPSQLAGNLQAIQNANVQLQGLSESTNRALERRLLIERQIADIQAIPLAPTQVVGQGPEQPVGTTAQQLEIVRARHAAFLQRYTPDHPEVITLERTIAELTARLEGETPLGGATQALEPILSPAEAAQRKKVLDLQAELAVVDHQLTTNRAEDQRLKHIIAEYQSKVDAVPSRESELVELTRDYSTLQAAYSSLLLKREDSMIAANLESRKIGEQFRILDPASRPEKPFNEWQRLAMTFSGAGVGLALGILIVAFLEFRDSSFRREEEVHQALSLPVLAMIPVLRSENEVRAARRRALLWDVAGSALVMACVAVVVLWRLQS
jgi:polysaccharide chain length determinant protein (PEP-CTERM system associated)